MTDFCLSSFCGSPAMKSSILRCQDNLNLTLPPSPPLAPLAPLAPPPNSVATEIYIFLSVLPRVKN